MWVGWSVRTCAPRLVRAACCRIHGCSRLLPHRTLTCHSALRTSFTALKKKKVKEKKKRIFCSAHGRRPPCTHRSIEFLFCYPSLMCSLCGSRLNVWHVGWGSRTVKSVPRVDYNNILLLFLFVCLFVGTRPTQRGGQTGVVQRWRRQRATEGQVKLATRLMLVCCCFGPGLCLVPVANRPLKYRISRIWKWNGTSRFESIWDGVYRKFIFDANLRSFP